MKKIYKKNQIKKSIKLIFVRLFYRYIYDIVQLEYLVMGVLPLSILLDFRGQKGEMSMGKKDFLIVILLIIIILLIIYRQKNTLLQLCKQGVYSNKYLRLIPICKTKYSSFLFICKFSLHIHIIIKISFFQVVNKTFL